MAFTAILLILCFVDDSIDSALQLIDSNSALLLLFGIVAAVGLVFGCAFHFALWVKKKCDDVDVK